MRLHTPLRTAHAVPPHEIVEHGVCHRTGGMLASPAARSSTPCILSTSAPVSSIHGARRCGSNRKACASRWTLSVSLLASMTACHKKAPTKHTYGSREGTHPEQGLSLRLRFGERL